jgi:hypothetical protein
MRARNALITIYTLLVTLAVAAPAMAGKGGEGTYGKTNDKVITNFGFGLIIFFTTLVITLSIAQYLLERRKTRR